MSDQPAAVLYNVVDGVAVITLNRPKQKNAFNTEMRKRLLQSLAQAKGDADVKTIVITGSGGAFSAGQDLVEGIAGGVPTQLLLEEEYRPIIFAIDQSEKLVIAAIDGPAAGVGSAIALACDLVVMSARAYYYQAFIAIALIPDGGANWQLVQQLGYKRALALVISGDKLSAEKAVDLGLANRVSMNESALGETLEWAKEITQKAPMAVRDSKRVLKEAQNTDLSHTFTYEASLQSVLTASDDAKEGIQAFVEKRKAVFKGC